MAKRRYGIDEARVRAYIREGRGQGSLNDYKPWLRIQNVPSNGRCHRPYGWKTGRTHHLLSDLEYHYFLLFNWWEQVTDIREQFPLDRDVTLKIAERQGIRHPREPGSDGPMVMTTDFLLNMGEGENSTLSARCIKYASDLDDERVVEKLEIERAYWAEKGVDWCIHTEQELPRLTVRSLDWLYGAWDISDMEEPHEGYYEALIFRFLGALPTVPDDKELSALCMEFDTFHNASPGTGLLLARHLLARRVLIANLNCECIWHAKASDICIASKLQVTAEVTGISVQD